MEDYGVFVEFQANGRTFTALLPGDEAKVRGTVLFIKGLHVFCMSFLDSAMHIL